MSPNIEKISDPGAGLGEPEFVSWGEALEQRSEAAVALKNFDQQQRHGPMTAAVAMLQQATGGIFGSWDGSRQRDRGPTSLPLPFPPSHPSPPLR